MINAVDGLLEHLWYLPDKVAYLLNVSDSGDIRHALGNFFINRFYDNILSSKSIEDNLLITLTLILKKEIEKAAGFEICERFLSSSNCSFVLCELIWRNDIQNYFKNILLDIIMELEQNDFERVFLLEPSKIANYLNDNPSMLSFIKSKAEEIPIANAKEKKNDNIINNICSSRIEKKAPKFIDEIRKHFDVKFADFYVDDLTSNEIKENIIKINEIIKNVSSGEKITEEQVGLPEIIRRYEGMGNIKTYDEILFGKGYENFTEEKKKEKLEYINEYLSYQLIDCINKESIFSNVNFFNAVRYLKNIKEIIYFYQKDFNRIMYFVNKIFNNFFDNSNSCPLSLRYLCTIIKLLINKYFPNATKTEINICISKFFFGVLFDEIIKDPALYTQINEIVITKNTLSNLSIIGKVFIEIMNFKLFMEEECEYTMFNRYIMSKTTDACYFLEKISSVTLPNFIERYISPSSSNSYYYDYFDENKNEDINNISICFSAEDLYCVFRNIEKSMGDFFIELNDNNINKNNIIKNNDDDKDNNNKIICANDEYKEQYMYHLRFLKNAVPKFRYDDNIKVISELMKEKVLVNRKLTEIKEEVKKKEKKENEEEEEISLKEEDECCEEDEEGGNKASIMEEIFYNAKEILNLKYLYPENKEIDKNGLIEYYKPYLNDIKNDIIESKDYQKIIEKVNERIQKEIKQKQIEKEKHEKLYKSRNIKMPEEKTKKYYYLFNKVIQSTKVKYFYEIKDKIECFYIKQGQNENQVVKFKNFLITLLFNCCPLLEQDFASKNTSLFDIMEHIKDMEPYFNNNKYDIPLHWYTDTISEFLLQLPIEYRMNDYHKIYEELMNDIENEMKKYDFDNLNAELIKIKQTEYLKNVSKISKTILLDIRINSLISEIYEYFIPVEMKFEHIKSKKFEIEKLNISKEKLSKYKQSDSKDKKTCENITSFIKSFPNFQRFYNLTGESTLDLEKSFKIAEKIIKYCEIIKFHLISLLFPDFLTDYEFSSLNNKIFDNITTKLYPKIFPVEMNSNDSKIFQKCVIFSSSGNSNKANDNILKETILVYFSQKKNYRGYIKWKKYEKAIPLLKNSFNQAMKEKSPRLKMHYIRTFFNYIENLWNSGDDEDKMVLVGEEMPIVMYSIIKCMPINLDSNIQFIKYYLKQYREDSFDNYYLEKLTEVSFQIRELELLN